MRQEAEKPNYFSSKRIIITLTITLFLQAEGLPKSTSKFIRDQPNSRAKIFSSQNERRMASETCALDCKECYSNSSTCFQCHEGFYLTDENSCAECDDPHCEVCRDDGTCLVCRSGYKTDDQDNCKKESTARLILLLSWPAFLCTVFFCGFFCCVYFATKTENPHKVHTTKREHLPSLAPSDYQKTGGADLSMVSSGRIMPGVDPNDSFSIHRTMKGGGNNFGVRGPGVGMGTFRQQGYGIYGRRMNLAMGQPHPMGRRPRGLNLMGGPPSGMGAPQPQQQNLSQRMAKSQIPVSKETKSGSAQPS